MAHADIFERISRQDVVNVVNKESKFTSKPETLKEPAVEKKAIETIKLLGKQILEIREILEQQTKTIKTLQHEVVSLRKRSDETDGNVKLVMIDQKDVNNQLRALKAAVNSHEYIDSRMPSREAFNPLPRPTQQSYQQPVQQPVSRAVQETRAAVQAQSQSQSQPPVNNRVGTPASSAEMNSAYQEITTAINQARLQLGLEPHPDLLGSVTRSEKVYPTRQAEDVAKEFIFGRIPKMLNLS